MRLLTIHQPWAWLICAGHKRFENRTWSTNYRGPILIHAGKSSDSLRSAIQLCDRLGIELPESLDFGAVIGMVELIDCTPVDSISDPFATGPFCFHLAAPVLFTDSIAWRGALGLVEPSAELLAAMNLVDSMASITGPQ